jgi:hypothetical protein
MRVLYLMFIPTTPAGGGAALTGLPPTANRWELILVRITARQQLLGQQAPSFQDRSR